MPETLTTSSAGSMLRPSELLKGKIEGLRRKHLSVAVWTGVALTLAVAIELMALAIFFDWWLELPWGVRLVSLLGQIGTFSFLAYRFILNPLLNQPDEDELALKVEKARPEFRSRLIASLQLTRPDGIPPGASPLLVDAMVEETEAIAKPIDFNAIISTERLRRFGMMAATVTLMAILAVAVGKGSAFDLIKRVFLSNTPVPRKTRVVVPEGDKIVGRGDSVRLEAFAEGIVPGSGRVEVKFRGRRLQEFALQQNRDNKRHFGRTIENVQDTFTYAMFLNDGRSQTFTVTVVPRPTVSTIECDQEFPAYTQMKTVRRSLGDLSLLAGSKLRLKITATKPIKTASILLVGIDETIPLNLNPQKEQELTGEFAVPAKGLTGFSIQMTDTGGMESRDSAVYRIDVIPDKAPAVRVAYPDRKEELITRLATMLVGIEANDDFAISKLRLKYKTDAIDEGAEKVVDLDLEGQSPNRLRRRHEWKIGDFAPPLPEGTMLEYWIEAEDNNNVTGPGITSSEHQLARVVSESEKRADLLNRAGDYLGSINDVATDQEKLNRNLGTIIREKSGSR